MRLSKIILSLEKQLSEQKHRAEKAAPEMIQDLMVSLSLRQIARRLKRSPTYISRVKTGACAVSVETYCELEKLWVSQQCDE